MAMVPRCPQFMVPSWYNSWYLSMFFTALPRIKATPTVLFIKYSCPNNLVAFWKNGACKLKEKNRFPSFLNDHNYALMRCVHLLGTAQLLKPWNQTGYQHPHFLFHNSFLSNHSKSSIAKTWCHQRKVELSNVGIANSHLKLVVRVVL